MQSTPTFPDLTVSQPSADVLASSHEALLQDWDATQTPADQIALIQAWDKGLMSLNNNSYLAMIHYRQDTQDPARRATKDFFDDLSPTVLGHKLDFLRKVTTSPHRAALEAHYGPQIFSIWDRFLCTFSPEIGDDKREESRLQSDYAALMAKIEVEVDGKTYSLSTLRALFGNPERSVRLRAMQAADAALLEVQDQLDEIYDGLVKLRHKMAVKLGYDNFIPLGYARMQRIGYGPEDVATFRAQVRDHVVPLAQRILQRRAKALGLSELHFQDESVRDLKGVPCPNGDHDWMMDQAHEMFGKLGPDFAAFFQEMRQRQMLDLKSRKGKAGGGFCCDLPAVGFPFIFANFNGTRDDVHVFTHEVGHAFQNHSASHLPLQEYHWPTTEGAEVHSMSLEYLTMPHMELFFGDDANRFRMDQLEGGILFLPYGVAVDEFQHRIYEEPNATPQRRADIWREVEAVYLPHRIYDDMPFHSSGRMWQRQRHIFVNPFYYIDYCLAGTCAMQMWRQSIGDLDGTLDRYRELCKLGGSLPFTDLLASVGLESPFTEGCLSGVCETVADAIEL